MKKLKYRMIDITTISMSIIIGILMYVPIYRDIALLPGRDADGNEIVVKTIYEKTPFERLQVINLDWLLYMAFTVVGVGFILCVFSFIVRNQRLNRFKNLVLVGATIMLTILLLIGFIQFANY